jgi:hypothetical protein
MRPVKVASSAVTNGPSVARSGRKRETRRQYRRVSTIVEGRRQPPILNIFVLQTGQTPCVAGLPFFMVILVASCISRLALHLTQ